MKNKENVTKLGALYTSNLKNKGITLIALVITIIILLILAGITIMQLTGSGLFGKAGIARQNTRYSNAKEIVNMKLLEIQADCVEKGEEYNIIKIVEGMELAEDITIEKYYNKETSKIKNGIDTEITDLKGVVVSVDEYSEYKFLIGEECQITGILEGEIIEGTVIQDFIDVEEFEKSLLKEVSKSTSNTKITYHPNDYTNKDSSNLLVTISNNKGIKAIKILDNDKILPQNGQVQVGIDYTVTKNGTYTFVVTDNEGNKETQNIEVNIFDRIEPKSFTPVEIEVDITSVIIKGNAEDGDETEESVKSGIKRWRIQNNWFDNKFKL